MEHQHDPSHSKANLDQEAAGNILASVFDQCSLDPNPTPIETIRVRKKRRRLLTALCWILALLVLAAFIVLPITFATARVELSWVEGKRVEPLRYDTGTGSVVFAFPDSSLNIFVCDDCGNQLQLILTVD